MPMTHVSQPAMSIQMDATEPQTSDTRGHTSNGQAADMKAPEQQTSTPGQSDLRQTPLEDSVPGQRIPRWKSQFAAIGSRSSNRIWALDVARALAVFGMIMAHTLDVPPVNPADPSTWMGVVHGNSAGLFGVLAGVSIALMTGRTRIPTVEEMPKIRLKLMTRGAIIFAFGLFAELLNTPVMVILCMWGIFYVAITPFIQLRRRYLALWSALFGLFGPTFIGLLGFLFDSPQGMGIQMLFFGIYDIPVWLSLMLAGMVIGRSNLSDLKNQLTIFTAGVVATGVVLGVGAGVQSAGFSGFMGFVEYIFHGTDSFNDDAILGSVPAFSGEASSNVSSVNPSSMSSMNDSVAPSDLTHHVCYPLYGDSYQCEPIGEGSNGGSKSGSGQDDTMNGSSHYGDGFSESIGQYIVPSVIDPSSHSGSTVEIVVILSLSLLVIGLCLLIVPFLKWLFIPLIAVGAQPLTAYILHLIVMFAIADPSGDLTALWFFSIVAGIVLVFCTLWWIFRGQGLLESFVARISRRAAGE